MEITCRPCGKSFLMRFIVQHVEKSKCKVSWSDNQLSSLKTSSKAISEAKKKAKDAERYLANRCNMKYDPIQRAKQYVQDKDKISQEYKNKKDQISLKRKELEEKKKSKGGKVFSKLYHKVCLDVYCKFEQERFDKAWEEEVEKSNDHENEVIDEIFTEESWLSNFTKQTFDESNNMLTCKEFSKQQKKPVYCVQHMSGKKMGELIETAMKEKFEEEVVKRMTNYAKDKVKKEFILAFNSDTFLNHPPDIYFEVKEKCINKAFRTKFAMKDDKVFEKAYNSAIEKFKASMNEKEANDDKEVEDFLIDELEDLGSYVASDLYDIFEKDFKYALEKKFLSFKETMPDLMRSANQRRKEWAFEKLAKIESSEEASLVQDKKILKILFEESKVQIEQIFEKYDRKIADSHENYAADVAFAEPFCFTRVVDLYPELDFLNNGTDNSFGGSIFDSYTVWEYWAKKHIEIRK